MGCITEIQCCKIKSSIVDMNNYLNKVYSSFNRLYKKLSLGFSLIDNFPNCFSFYTVNYKDTNTRIAYWNKLKKIYKDLSNSHEIILIISNVSIKNNIAILVLYIQREHKIIMKTVYHAMNITFTEAEIFTIRCSISQLSQLSQMQGVIHIVIVTNTITTNTQTIEVLEILTIWLTLLL